MKTKIIGFGALIIVLVISLFIMGRGNNEMTKNMENKIVTLKTNLGDIKIELFAAEAPQTVNNFIKLAESDFYNRTKFHRVIKDFMIQGGDPLSKEESQKNFWGTGGPGYVFDDEVNNVNLVQGVIAMANAGPNTNGSQFFIITANETPWLQGKHTGFGTVIEGMDVVMNIQDVETEGPDRPVEDIIINSVVIE
jgi:cyclophilin family peptidyl-prolyl cis-trans isomerase